MRDAARDELPRGAARAATDAACALFARTRAVLAVADLEEDQADRHGYGDRESSPADDADRLRRGRDEDDPQRRDRERHEEPSRRRATVIAPLAVVGA